MAGNSSATKIPMIAMTTSNSTSVNPATRLNLPHKFLAPQFMLISFVLAECSTHELALTSRHTATVKRKDRGHELRMCEATIKTSSHAGELTQIGFHAI